MASKRRIRDNLRRAKRIIKERGLTRCTLISNIPSSKGRVCALGAIGLGAGLDEENLDYHVFYSPDQVASCSQGGRENDGCAWPEVEALINVLPDQHGIESNPMSKVYMFNDDLFMLGDEDPTKAVLAAFDRAIKSVS